MCEFTAHYACKNAEMNLKSATTNGFNFRIINSLMGAWGVRLTLLDCKSELAGTLQVIFNTSFLTGIVPDKFKLARVIPVLKKGFQTSLSNYRPISLLSVFNKLLEKLMFNRLADFLEKRHLIYNKQFGFCSPFN